MRPVAAGTLKAVFFIFASLCAWYSGYLLAELIPDVHLSSAVYSIQSIGKRPVLKVPRASHSQGQQSSQEHRKNHQCFRKRRSELALTRSSKVHTMFLLSSARHDEPN